MLLPQWVLCYNAAMMGDVTMDCPDLSVADVEFLGRVASDLSILADVCRADLLLFCRDGADRAKVVAQAQPHSSSPLYEASSLGKRWSSADQTNVLRGLGRRQHSPALRTIEVGGATVARQLFPVRNDQGRPIAVLAKDAYWLAHERHKRRSRLFQDAILDLIAMVLRGDLIGAKDLTAFGEHDGIMYVGADRRVHYMSGIAAELYRHLGYRDSLLGRRISDIDTIDQELVTRAMAERRCCEVESEQDGLTWGRKALPIFAVGEGLIRSRNGTRWGRPRSPKSLRQRGALILIHDATEALRARRELESKMAMLREVHHRVKNNLQIIASLMRLQSRRTDNLETRAALKESVNRVLSVAVVHEFLSQNAQGMINVGEVARRIISQTQNSLIDPKRRIRLGVRGPDVWLHSERATQCALVINELVQNAIEHGLTDRQSGTVQIELVDLGERVSIIVSDDGEGLPGDFDLDSHSNLGLRIARSMVERDLRGQFDLRSSPGDGTRARVHFDKSV